MNPSVNFQINLVGDAFLKIDKINAQIDTVSKTVVKLDNSVNNSFNKLREKISLINFDSLLNIADRTVRALDSIGAPGVGFQQNMANLSSITGIAGKDLDKLGEVARRTGKASGLGAAQAADAFAILASQIQVDKIGMEGLIELQSKTITLSHAAGMSMNDAAISLAGTINQFGLSADQAERVINVLAAGSKYGAAEIVDLSQSFKVVGAAANAAGLSVEDTAGAVEVLSKNNLKGAEAGTALRNIVLKMQTALGVDFSKFSLAQALDALKPKLKDATYLSKVFGMENIAAAQFLIANSDAVAEMTAQVTGTNVANEQAAIRTETVAAKMERMRAAVDDAKISMFNLFGTGYAWLSVGGEQLVMVSQLIPLISTLGQGISWITKMENLRTLATQIGTAAQWALNAAFWANPVTWIVAGIAALVAGIVVCWNKFEGFRGAVLGTWEVMKKFGSLLWDSILGAIKNLISGLGSLGSAIWKLFKGDFKGAAKDAFDGASKLAKASPLGVAVDVYGQAKGVDWKSVYADGKQQAFKSLEPSESPIPVVKQPVNVVPEPVGGNALNLNLSGKVGKIGKSNVIDLNKVAGNYKGTTAYGAISEKLQGVRMPAASSSAGGGLLAAASGSPAPSGSSGSSAPAKRGMSLSKFCEQIVINIKDGTDPSKIKDAVVSAMHDIMLQYEPV